MALRPRVRDEGEPPEALQLADIEVVPMRRRHVRSVLAIEEAVFPAPWSYGLYLTELAQPSSRTYVVARYGQRVIGYGGLMLAVGDAHVTTLAVAPGWQRRGIGRVLLLRLAREACARGAAHLTLEVRVTNVAAQALYREFGFVPAGIRKNYYAEVNEDAIVMWAYDVATPEYAARLDAIASRLR
jgi:ribosomal-protein-alanine N-acetyltransferase